MAFTFDSTISGTSSNSYVSVADSDDYFDGHPKQSLWTQLSTSEKQQFLVKSTSRLDYENYGGDVTDDTQSLQWPRQWIVSRNSSSYRDSTVHPRELKIATYEQALWYVEEWKEESPMFSRNDIDRMEQVSIGPLSATLRKQKESAFPDEVVRALQAIGPNGWKGRSIKLVR